MLSGDRTQKRPLLHSTILFLTQFGTVSGYAYGDGLSPVLHSYAITTLDLFRPIFECCLDTRLFGSLLSPVLNEPNEPFTRLGLLQRLWIEPLGGILPLVKTIYSSPFCYQPIFNLRHHPLQVSRLRAPLHPAAPEYFTLAYLTYGQNAGITPEVFESLLAPSSYRDLLRHSCLEPDMQLSSSSGSTHDRQ